MASMLALRTCNIVRAAPAVPHAALPGSSLPVRPTAVGLPRSAGLKRGHDLLIARASPRGTQTETVDVDAIVKDLQVKWDKVENKTSVVVYALGALALLWLSSTIVGAVNAIPLLPKLLELVGLGYTAWFVYRYLLFKSSREELIQDIDELKKKISGVAEETAGKPRSSSF